MSGGQNREFVMLALVMLLQTLPLNPDKPALPRLLDLVTAECVDENGCPVEGGRRYRLASQPVVGEDSMARAMHGVWEACETTGAPKCPSRGRLILRAEIESD
jgi:hypothetical protein